MSSSVIAFMCFQEDSIFFVYKYIKNVFYSAEQQRNQALQNAEGLKEAFKDYKATMSAKYQKVKLFVFVIILVCFSGLYVFKKHI